MKGTILTWLMLLTGGWLALLLIAIYDCAHEDFRMKGTCYSGIVYFPEHPEADMHGLIRVAVRTRGKIAACEKLNRANLAGYLSSFWDTHIWTESQSHAEQQATATHYGELLACGLQAQYLRPENYKPIPKTLRRKRA